MQQKDAALITFHRLCSRNGIVIMTVHDLPERVVRWTPNLKAMLIDAVDKGALTTDDLKRRYNIGLLEFGGWRLRLQTGGPEALKQKNARGVERKNRNAARIEAIRRKQAYLRHRLAQLQAQGE